MQALGTTDTDFFNGLMGQLINAGTQGKKPDERSLQSGTDWHDGNGADLHWVSADDGFDPLGAAD